jgi:hypothetical protein
MLIIVRPVVGSVEGAVVIASESTVPTIFISMKRPFSEKVLKRWSELNAPILRKLTLKNSTRRFWQSGGGFDRNVGDEDIMWKKICYIHQNPVERGLVKKPEDWKWSSARWYAGQREGQIPIDYEKGRREWSVPARWLEEGKRLKVWRR